MAPGRPETDTRQHSPPGATSPRPPWGAQAELRPLAPGVLELRLSTPVSRGIGLLVTPFLVDDVLIDTGFPRVAALVLDRLAAHPLSAIALTHHHEDHCGAAALLAATRSVPILLAHPELADREGVVAPLPYRRIVWGVRPPFAARPLPERLPTARRELWVVPTPGHSATHVAFFEERTGLLFSGDLYIAGNVAPILPEEAPWAHADSLRRCAELDPRLMLTGHGAAHERPAARLRAKAARIEQALEQVHELLPTGLSDRAIVARLFRTRPGIRATELATGGEFSRLNFVRACRRQVESTLR